MTALQAEVKAKRDILRSIYGGMMSLSDLCQEIGMNKDRAREWAKEHEVGALIGTRVKYDTDLVAKAIVYSRGAVA